MGADSDARLMDAGPPRFMGGFGGKIA